MKNFIPYIIGGVIVALLFLHWPTSCDRKSSEAETKAIQSFKLDSLQQIATKKAVRSYDSTLRIMKREDSISKITIKSLSAERNAYRAIIRNQKLLRVDSSNQTITLPVVEYNAGVQVGIIDDSLYLEYENALSRKDSVNIVLEKKYESEKQANDTCTQALTNQVALTQEVEKKLNNAQKWKRAIPKIMLATSVATTMVIVIIANSIH